MELSDIPCAQHHKIQHLLIALDQLGKNFGHNRDTYYTLGRYLGYTDASLKDPLSWILCDTAVKTSANIPDFVSTLEQYFIKYGLWENFQHFIICNGFSSLLTFLLEFILVSWKNFSQTLKRQ